MLTIGATHEYVRWRRQQLEDTQLLFNVPADAPPEHVCTNESSVPLSAALALYGCRLCGQTHVCRREWGHCPTVTSHLTQYAPVCLFSGGQVASASGILGSFDVEGEMATSAAIVDDHPDAVLRTTSAQGHRQRANFSSDGATRRREWTRADNAAALEHASRQVRQAVADTKRQQQRQQLQRLPPNRKRTHDAAFAGNHHVDADADAHRDDMHAATTAFATAIGAEDRARDVEWPRQQWRIMESAFATAAALLVADASDSPAVEEATPPIAKADASASSLQGRQWAVPDYTLCAQVRQGVVHLVQTLQSMYVDADAGGEPRLEQYVTVVTNMALLRGRTLAQAQELFRFVAHALLQLLTHDKVARDASQHLVVIWSADPWLRRMAEQHRALAPATLAKRFPKTLSDAVKRALRDAQKPTGRDVNTLANSLLATYTSPRALAAALQHPLPLLDNGV
jgi:hypothetical protein